MENDVEILKKQVKALNELLEIKDKIIEALRATPQQTVVYRYEYHYPQYQQQLYQPGYPYQVYCGGGATMQGQQGANQMGGGIAGACNNAAPGNAIQTTGLAIVPNHAVSQWGSRS